VCEGCLRLSQRDLYVFLKKHKNKWFTARMLEAFMPVCHNSLVINMRKLKFYSDVELKEDFKPCKATDKRCFAVRVIK